MRRRLILTALLGALVTLPGGAQAHAPGVVLSGFGTPTLDGVLAPGEWAPASFVDFTVGAPDENATGFPLPTTPVPARLWVMNDAVNLYMALQVERPYLGTTSFAAEFDNDHDGVIFEDGHDAFVFNAPSTFFDNFRSRRPPCPPNVVCGFFDTSDGGTIDGAGAARNDGLHTVLEVRKPLDSADDAHDFSLRAGDTVGFQLFIRLFNRLGACCADTVYPRPFGDIRIERSDTSPPETEITGGPVEGAPTNATDAEIAFTGADDITALGDLSFTCRLDGVEAPCTSPTRYEGLAEGPHTFSVQATDSVGNTDPTPAVLSWTVDLTPPSVSASANPSLLWPPNHELIPVSINIEAADASGIASIVLSSAMSSEPGGADDLVDFEPGTLDTQLRLRAERYGSGSGRTYTLVYLASDRAGNVAEASAIVVVPHDRSH